jgi:hypothetical protein
MLLFAFLSIPQTFLHVVNNLVEKDELVAWNRLKEEHRDHTITKLLHTVEESTLTLARKYKATTEIEIKEKEMGKKSTTPMSLSTDTPVAVVG